MTAKESSSLKSSRHWTLLSSYRTETLESVATGQSRSIAHLVARTPSWVFMSTQSRSYLRDPVTSQSVPPSLGGTLFTQWRRKSWTMYLAFSNILLIHEYNRCIDPSCDDLHRENRALSDFL